MNSIFFSEDSKKITRCAVVILTVLTLFRFFYCTYLDVIADEAYYLLWSKHLDASYYSKGPAIAWTIAFGTAIFGDNAFGIRWLAVLLAAGTGWQLFLLARHLFSPAAGLAAILVAAVIPLCAVGSVLMTIDPLSVFFWVLAANLFWTALERDRHRDWAFVGLAVGCGFLAKFVNALELAAFAFFLALSPAHRRHWRNPKLLWTLLVFIICTLPVLYWNAKHGWITATHLQERGSLNHSVRFSLSPFIGFFIQQALVISPLLFITVFSGVISLTFRADKPAPVLYLLCLFWTVFGFYAVLAFNDSGEANWTATAYPAAVILAAVYWLNICRRSKLWRGILIAVWILTFIGTALLHETRWLNLPRGYDPLDRARGWESFGSVIHQVRLVHQPDVLIGNKYQTASLLSYYLPDRPTTYIPHSKRIENQFSFWPTYTVKPGTKALFVTDNREGIPDELLAEFSRAQSVHMFDTTEHGRKLTHYDVFLLQKY